MVAAIPDTDISGMMRVAGISVIIYGLQINILSAGVKFLMMVSASRAEESI
jgi:hypothetical protein